jgi:lysozyme
MEYLKTFESYNDNLILERLDIQPLFDMLKSSINKNSIATLIVGSLLAVSSVSQATNFIENSPDLDQSDKITLVKAIKKYHDPLILRLSQSGWEHIKNHEKLKLQAYSIGDGMITIGYGHATPVPESKYKVGDKISIKTANKLFIEDMNIAAKGVRRIFEEWKEQGINVKLTQNQYDVMVSMAFNMGLTNFRTSKFIQLIKKNKLTRAASKIKTTGIRDNYPGLAERRMDEYKKFIS